MYTEDHSSIGDYQYGFRRISQPWMQCLLYSQLSNIIFFNNKRLYVGMVDPRKCFDGINRNALWFKLHNTGIKGNTLRILKNMYSQVKSCVKQCNSFSDLFTCSVGLRQGEVVSPVLVSLFLDDLDSYLRANSTSSICIKDIVFTVLTCCIAVCCDAAFHV